MNRYEQLELFSGTEICTCALSTSIKLMNSGAYNFGVRALDLIDYVYKNLRLFRGRL